MARRWLVIGHLFALKSHNISQTLESPQCVDSREERSEFSVILGGTIKGEFLETVAQVMVVLTALCECWCSPLLGESLKFQIILSTYSRINNGLVKLTIEIANPKAQCPLSDASHLSYRREIAFCRIKEGSHSARECTIWVSKFSHYLIICNKIVNNAIKRNSWAD